MWLSVGCVGCSRVCRRTFRIHYVVTLISIANKRYLRSRCLLRSPTPAPSRLPRPIRGPALPVPTGMVRIHPITLRFDDDDMERELKAGTLNASRLVYNLFFILDILCRAVFPLNNIMFDASSDTSKAVAYTCVAVTYTTVSIALRHARTLQVHEAVEFQDKVWMSSWVVNIGAWWAMQACGLARRLNAGETQGAAVICAMWAFVLVLQHALHIGFRCRVTVLLLATAIALTSVAWRKEMLAALMFGEAVGYCMEHMVRSSYLPRAETLEQVRMAKERSDYDLRLLAHSRARSTSRTRSRASSRSRSRSEGGRSLRSQTGDPLNVVAWVVDEANGNASACSSSSDGTGQTRQ